MIAARVVFRELHRAAAQAFDLQAIKVFDLQ